MVDSPHHPEQEVIFALGEAGVIDPDSETKTKKTTKATKKTIKPVETESISETTESKNVSEIPETESESD